MYKSVNYNPVENDVLKKFVEFFRIEMNFFQLTILLGYQKFTLFIFYKHVLIFRPISITLVIIPSYILYFCLMFHSFTNSFINGGQLRSVCSYPTPPLPISLLERDDVNYPKPEKKWSLSTLQLSLRFELRTSRVTELIWQPTDNGDFQTQNYKLKNIKGLVIK